jgi:hypothetical protein
MEIAMKIVQQSAFLSAMLVDVISGRLIPAAFQRPYVWTKADVLALIESIVKGYPIGGFLQWTPYDKADLSTVGKRRLGPVAVASGSRHVSLLLDGQNRLATLAWMGWDPNTPAPAGLTDYEREMWAGDEVLVCEMAERIIKFVPRAEADVGLRMPARALLDSRVLARIAREKWDTVWNDLSEKVCDDGLDWLGRCQDAFNNARIVVTDLQNASATEAKDAFLHICKVGVPMSEADFEAALHWEAVN